LDSGDRRRASNPPRRAVRSFAVLKFRVRNFLSKIGSFGRAQRGKRTAHVRETTTSKCKTIVRARDMPRTTQRSRKNPAALDYDLLRCRSQSAASALRSRSCLSRRWNRVDHHDGGGHLEGGERVPAVLE